MLTSQIRKTVEIPGEPGQTITIRKLSHGQLKEARRAKLDDTLKMAGAFAGMKDVLPEPTPEQKAAQTAAAEDPKFSYDETKALQFGIVAWTYTAPVSDSAIADLDEETAAWAFDEIMAHTLRSAEDTKASGADLHLVSLQEPDGPES